MAQLQVWTPTYGTVKITMNTAWSSKIRCIQVAQELDQKLCMNKTYKPQGADLSGMLDSILHLYIHKLIPDLDQHARLLNG